MNYNHKALQKLMTHSKLRKLCVLLLMTTILIPLLQIKFVQAQSNIPQVIHSCQTNNVYGETYCSTWRWDGSYYEIINSEGEQNTGLVMDVERFDKDSVVIYGVSTSSSDPDPIQRRQLSYKGHPNGNQIKNGVVTHRAWDINIEELFYNPNLNKRPGGLMTSTWNAHW